VAVAKTREGKRKLIPVRVTRTVEGPGDTDKIFVDVVGEPIVLTATQTQVVTQPVTETYVVTQSKKKTHTVVMTETVVVTETKEITVTETVPP
jgi:hypothetical protein